MKTVIYYFSGTGNSLVVARDVAAALKDAQVLAISSAAAKSQPKVGPECVGIVFPVYMFGLPLIVAEFLQKVAIPREAYVFVIATYGGLAGRCFAQVARILKSRGINLAASFGVRMPGNYIPLYEAISESRQQGLFQKERADVKLIADTVVQRQKVLYHDSHPVLNYILYALLYSGGSKRMRSADKGFWVTAECTHCGVCRQVCPVSNIELVQGRPAWLHHCEQCMACLQWCPVEAIQYKKNTLGRKRYHHPSVKADDLVKQQG